VWRSSTTYADGLAELSHHGASIWLDSLSRGRLNGGGLAALVSDRHVVGVTTGPTILEQGAGRQRALRQPSPGLGLRGVSPEEAARSMIGHDARWACDVLRPVSDRTGGVDGRASIAVDPQVDHDTAKTVAEAATRRLRLSVRRSPTSVSTTRMSSAPLRETACKVCRLLDRPTSQSPGGPVRQDRASIPDAAKIMADPNPAHPLLKEDHIDV
jgi:hypothetical protein